MRRCLCYQALLLGGPTNKRQKQGKWQLNDEMPSLVRVVGS
jgi:hypothetical protein